MVRLYHRAIKQQLSRKPSLPPVDYEVLIIGAGIAGIGMACQLQRQGETQFFGKKPAKKLKGAFKRGSRTPATQRFLVLEKRDDLGGTWDLFTYPGIRSDSDALTFGYGFRPWLDKKILASGSAIKRYIKDTAREYHVIEHIRYRHEVQQLSWSSSSKRWTALVKNHASGEVLTVTASFVVGATGYYDYESGHRPSFAGEVDFAGQIVHPQHWDNVDYADKNVVVIGSGATAITLVPAMVAEDNRTRARHVTMLQRTPTYIASVPGDDDMLARLSGRLSPLSKQQAYQLLRVRNVMMQQGIYQAAKRAPRVVKAALQYGVKKHLKGSGVNTEHFKPPYNPWDERLCAVPDGDLFEALHSDRADVVTDRIEYFTTSGIKLASGKHLDADIIVTATGLKLQMLGGAALYVDGEPVDIGTRMTYKAVMIEGVPNMAVLFGYTNASWTLKIDLACQYLMRLRRYMVKKGYSQVCAQAKTEHGEVQVQPDNTVLGSLSAGYVRRAKDKLPKQGDRYPWRVTNNYLSDRIMLKYRKINDEWLTFSR